MPVKCRPYFVLPAFRPGPRTATPESWTVPALLAAYEWPAKMAGTGIIGIGELGGGFVMSDLEAYFKGIGQPMPTVTVISVDGTKNDPGKSDDDIEVTLDVELAGASFYAATGRPAEIRVYFAQSIDAATAAAAADRCAVMSWSWGADEAEWGDAAVKAMQAAAVKATATGMVILAAAGDNDSSDGGPNAANVDCPASCPGVIGCGGTSKPKSGPETVWNDNPGSADGEGTGGGYSRVFVPWPTWQADAVPAPPAPPAGRGRLVPDVAACADPQTGIEIYVHGAPMIVGGTSCVAPLYAGLLAALSRQGDLLGNFGPDLWEHPECFALITEGENGKFSAGPWPSPCTGLGVPIGVKLAELVIG